ncbi:MAG: hypothetical protein RL689_219 [Planctomycetota bacterium]|jgi:SAM-dependent methyltransferase
MAGWFKRTFPFLSWPLMSYRDEVDLAEPDGGLRGHVEAARFSLRLQRYWWAARKLADEADKVAPAPFVVADLGCERGWLKRFTPRRTNIVWVGLDGNVSSPALGASRYDRVIECNFDERLPMDDASVDAVVSLHVFEHLPNPPFTLGEVARILKPGGCFLAGSPTGPGPVSWVRTIMHGIRQRAGRNRPVGHLQSLSPARWHRLCCDAGLPPEFVTGSHFMRRTGWSLESAAWWVRLNQAWGGLFPSLGSEVYLSGRKDARLGNRLRLLMGRLRLDTDWMQPVAAGLTIALLFGAAFAVRPSFSDNIAVHQDGNDVFALCPMTAPSTARHNGSLVVVPCLDSVERLFDAYAAEQRDLHLIVHADHLDAYLDHRLAPGLHVADEWTEGDHRFLVLSTEADRPRLHDYAANS